MCGKHLNVPRATTMTLMITASPIQLSLPILCWKPFVCLVTLDVQSGGQWARIGVFVADCLRTIWAAHMKRTVSCRAARGSATLCTPWYRQQLVGKGVAFWFCKNTFWQTIQR